MMLSRILSQRLPERLVVSWHSDKTLGSISSRRFRSPVTSSSSQLPPDHWSVTLVRDVTSSFLCKLQKWKNDLDSSRKNVKLKQELVSKLQEIVASKNLDTKGMFLNSGSPKF